MSRGQQNSTGRLRLAPAVLGLGLAALLGAVGCSAGQVTQTDSQLPAVNGAIAQAGPLAVRDAKLLFPHGGFYAEGANAPLILTIVNSGATDDKLVDVSTPFATAIEVDGDTNLPANAALRVGKAAEDAEAALSSSSAPTTTSGSASPSSAEHPTSAAEHPTTTTAPTTSAAPSSAATSSAATSSAATPEVGQISIVLAGLTEKLYPGRTIPVTFVFAKAGTITVELPIGEPTHPRGESASH